MMPSVSGKNTTAATAMKMNDMDSARIFIETIPAAMRLVRTEMRKAAGPEFSVPQYRLLLRIWREPSSNQELAAWLGVKPPTMSRMVDSLVKRGLALREPSQNPNDRRSIRIAATEAGIIKVKKMRQAAAKTFALQMAELSPDEKKTLVKGLLVIKKHFNLSKNQVHQKRERK